MALSFLDIPREIRDQIYICILAPTGYLTLYRPLFQTAKILYAFESYPDLEEISLALLRTCRQVYQESKDVFWNNNIFYTPLYREMNTVHRIPYFDICRPHNTRFEHRIAKLELSGRLWLWTFERFQKILPSLCDWARHGALKSLCFNVGETSDFVERLRDSGREGGLSFVSILRSFWETRTELAELGVSVRLDLKVGEPEYDAMQLEAQLKRLRAASFEKIPRLMHDSLGGELWIDGVLCFKNGLEVRNIFTEWEKRVAEGKLTAVDQEDT